MDTIKIINPRFSTSSKSRSSRSSPLKTLRLSSSKIPKIFTQYFMIFNIFLIISNPNTYICDPIVDDTALRYSNYNNGISCSSLLPTYIDRDTNNDNYSTIYFEDECLINTDDNEYLFELFHCNYNNQQVYNSKYNRYHYYYHYDLEKSLNTSYSIHFQNYIQEITNWWKLFSFDKVWHTIPPQWKVTTAFIGIIDALFVVIIKYLVFEDNYAF